MNEASVVLEVAKQIPSLLVLCWVVIYFLRYLRELSAQHETHVQAIVDSNNSRLQHMSENFRAQMAAIADRYHQDSARSTQLYEQVVRRLGPES